MTSGQYRGKLLCVKVWPIGKKSAQGLFIWNKLCSWLITRRVGGAFEIEYYIETVTGDNVQWGRSFYFWFAPLVMAVLGGASLLFIRIIFIHRKWVESWTLLSDLHFIWKKMLNCKEQCVFFVQNGRELWWRHSLIMNKLGLEILEQILRNMIT